MLDPNQIWRLQLLDELIATGYNQEVTAQLERAKEELRKPEPEETEKTDEEQPPHLEERVEEELPVLQRETIFEKMREHTKITALTLAAAAIGFALTLGGIHLYGKYRSQQKSVAACYAVVDGACITKDRYLNVQAEEAEQTIKEQKEEQKKPVPPWTSVSPLLLPMDIPGIYEPARMKRAPTVVQQKQGLNSIVDDVIEGRINVQTPDPTKRTREDNGKKVIKARAEVGHLLRTLLNKGEGHYSDKDGLMFFFTEDYGPFKAGRAYRIEQHSHSISAYEREGGYVVWEKDRIDSIRSRADIQGIMEIPPNVLFGTLPFESLSKEGTCGIFTVDSKDYKVIRFDRKGTDDHKFIFSTLGLPEGVLLKVDGTCRIERVFFNEDVILADAARQGRQISKFNQLPCPILCDIVY